MSPKCFQSNFEIIHKTLNHKQMMKFHKCLLHCTLALDILRLRNTRQIYSLTYFQFHFCGIVDRTSSMSSSVSHAIPYLWDCYFWLWLKAIWFMWCWNGSIEDKSLIRWSPLPVNSSVTLLPLHTIHEHGLGPRFQEILPFTFQLFF